MSAVEGDFTKFVARGVIVLFSVSALIGVGGGLLSSLVPISEQKADGTGFVDAVEAIDEDGAIFALDSSGGSRKPPRNDDSEEEKRCHEIYKALKKYNLGQGIDYPGGVKSLPDYGVFNPKSADLGSYGLSLFERKAHVRDWADIMKTYCWRYGYQVDNYIDPKTNQAIFDIRSPVAP